MRDNLKIFWKWVNDNSSAIQAVSTVVIVLFTVFSVIFSHQLIKEQKRQSVVAYRAYIFIDKIYLMESDARSILVDIKNAGLTPAEKIIFTAYAQIDNKKVALKIQGYETSLGPNQEITLGLPSTIELINAMSSSTDNYLRVEIDYRDFQNKKYKSVNAFNYFKDINGGYNFSTFEQEESSL